MQFLKPNSYFTPFGAGRRSCLGEKLALVNMFLILAGLFHQTKGKLISLPNGPGSADLRPETRGDPTVSPHPYKICFTSQVP